MKTSGNTKKKKAFPLIYRHTPVIICNMVFWHLPQYVPAAGNRQAAARTGAQKTPRVHENSGG